VFKAQNIYNKTSTLRTVPKDLLIDYQAYLNKPFLVGSYKWQDTAGVGVSLVQLNCPSDILKSAYLKIPFENSSLYRCKAKVLVQVLGTAQHQGILLVAAQPAFDTSMSGAIHMNDRLNAPHTFLCASSSTSVELEIPFYSNSKLLSSHLDTIEKFNPSVYSKGDFAHINVAVVNPLVAPTSGSTTLTYTIHVVFTEMEFYAPYADVKWVAQGSQSLWNRFTGVLSTMFDDIAMGSKKVVGDFIDIGRGALKQYTGLHNGNMPSISSKDFVISRNSPNTVDDIQTMEKLDPYNKYNRITRDYTFDTDLDEMLVSNIISKPQFIKTISVKLEDTTGKLLFSRPITPVQEVYEFAGRQVATANAQIISYLTRYWSGSINIHIQADMTSFHSCKLAVFRTYAPHSSMIENYPSYDSINGLLVDYLEFSAGGQTQTINIPYCSALQNQECTRDWLFNAIQHGVYYIYLAQPLVSSGNVSKSVNFNIYYSMGEDAQFYGYAADNANTLISKVVEDPEEFEAQGDVIFPVNEDMALETLDASENTREPDCEMHRPLVSMRDIVRRLTPTDIFTFTTKTLSETDGIIAFPVSHIMGLTLDYSATQFYGNLPPHHIARQFFLGHDGGVKIKLKITGTTNAEVYYIPPGSYVETGEKQKRILATSPFTSNNTQAGLALKSFKYVPGNTHSKPPAPRQEAANYSISDDKFHVEKEKIDTELLPFADECIFDLEIPNLNPYRYVGSAVLYEPYDKRVDAVNDMGTIIISIKGTNKAVYAPASVAQYAPIIVQVDSAYSDETRMGFQVKAGSFSYPSFTVGDTKYICTVFGNQYTDGLGPKLNPKSYKYLYFD
jgi:hypothetical protein